MNQDTLQKIGTWLAGDDTGMSSKFLAALALGSLLPAIAYPHDPSDLGRCIRFLEILDDAEKREVLRLAKHRSQEWEALVDRWDDVVALYEKEAPTGRCPKLYRLMKDLGL